MLALSVIPAGQWKVTLRRTCYCCWASGVLKSGAHNCGDFVHLNGSLDSVTVASEQAHIYRPKSNIQNILDHTRHTSRCFQEHSRTYYCDLVVATTVEYTQLNKLSCIMHAVIQVYRQVLLDCTHTRKQTALLFLRTVSLTGVPPHGCISTRSSIARPLFISLVML
jgi:hypothetical protein